jgi:hypothetical protein
VHSSKNELGENSVWFFPWDCLSSNKKIPHSNLEKYNSDRFACSSIIRLLPRGAVISLQMLRCDELLHFYQGLLQEEEMN